MSLLRGLKVSQFVAHLTEGDAISTDCLEIDSILRAWGCRTHIYADEVDGGIDCKASSVDLHRPDPEEVCILHYSLWSRSARHLLNAQPKRLVLVYHNVTPPQYFRGLNNEAERVTKEGLKALPDFVPATTLALGDSEFNQQDLQKAGFRLTGVLPIAIPSGSLDIVPNPRIMRDLDDGYVNLLSVGRTVPNKRLEDVIKVFYHYKRHINPRSRLYLVGPADMGVPYRSWLTSLVDYLGIDPHVFFPGRVSNEDLVAYYRSARAYICMSEHEGFCVPLLESIYLGVPILAYSAGAVPGTLGDAGILFRGKHYGAMSEALKLIVEEGAVRDRQIALGRRRCQDFTRETVAGILLRHLETVLQG